MRPPLFRIEMRLSRRHLPTRILLMRQSFSSPPIVVLSLLVFSLAGGAVLGEDAVPSFSRQVRPILAKHCFTCHGPDAEARESDLRLDRAEAAYEDLGGYAAITPGDPQASDLYLRVVSDDDGLRMPPSDSHPPLSASEIETLRRWIAAGGEYETHWSFVGPARPQTPEVKNASWCRGAIDRFVLARLEQAGLKPAPQATRFELVRRLFLDLTGVTPGPEEVQRFVGDDDPQAYTRLVDRLLASPDYAERFARPWLDLARYSDTNGYEKDRPRSIWPYRDWVIGRIAVDMPFDQFSIEQLAGDMLPGATPDQQIATGFHRNTMINEEGGIDPNEYRFYAMVDRVATTGTVWMGLTTGCAQCHTHKYDPITHTDYYSLLAMLNNADEPDVVVPDALRQMRRREIESEISAEVSNLADQFLPQKLTDTDPIHQAFDRWVQLQLSQSRHWQSLRPTKMTSTLPKLTLLEDDSILASGDVTKREVYRLSLDVNRGDDAVTALKLEVLPHPSLPDGGPGMAFYEGRRGDFFLSEVSVRFGGQPVTLQDASHSFGKISVGSGSADASNVIDSDGSTGWSTSGNEGKSNRLVVNFAEPLSAEGELEVELLFERHYAAALGRFRVSLTRGPSPAVAMSLPQELEQSLDQGVTAEATILDEDLSTKLRQHFVRVSAEMKEHRRRIEQLEAEMPATVRSLGMRERSRGDHRQTHRHHRGEYLQTREVVEPSVPAAFPPLEPAEPADRLALARWLVSEKNPLVGRVTANRAWREFFGTGIVRTAGDFGTQSEPPSHPGLLDWLAEELRTGGWSMKRLHRQIVLSATYRQSVGEAPESDPGNRLLSRFPYHRLDAERIRDALLSASGLLFRKIGGESVHPPQPATVTQMAYGSPSWKTSVGGDRFRRSIYTFAKRTAPFAAYTTFDGPTGENCIARRDRSTTPLQAMTLLNDAMFTEIARALAEVSVREAGSGATTREIARLMFRRLLVRPPDPQELAAIVDFYEHQSGHAEPWTLVARALINTDEAITTP
jgi:hypothetical protein